MILGKLIIKLKNRTLRLNNHFRSLSIKSNIVFFNFESKMKEDDKKGEFHSNYAQMERAYVNSIWSSDLQKCKAKLFGEK